MKKFLMLLLAFACFHFAIAQDSSSLLSPVAPKLFEKVSKAQRKATDKMQKQNEKLLYGLHAKEENIYKKLYAFDSSKANEVYTGVAVKYQTLEKKITDPAAVIDVNRSSQYIPRIDSLQTMLKFLQPFTKKKEQVEKALTSVAELRNKLTQAEDIKAFLTEREIALKNIVQSYTKLPAGITKSIARYTKEFYYYKERIAGWKETLKEPSKLEQTALMALNKIPAFQAFWQQNSELANLFSIPGNAFPSFAVLQTRQSVMQQLAQRIGSAGINPQKYLQQQVQVAQGALDHLKEKAGELRSGDIGDASQPGFTPNHQKTQPFLKRLVYTCDLQTGVKQFQFPATNDLAITIGYKLNDRLITGVGLAYKFGLGETIKQVHFTNDGIGFRSFIDWKMTSPQKGVKVLFQNIWLSGGFEKNYWARFKNASELSHIAWQESGLIGIAKKIRQGKREMKAQVLWDFINQSNSSKPFLFRFGYSF